jgi:hypothetical protein
MLAVSQNASGMVCNSRLIAPAQIRVLRLSIRFAIRVPLGLVAIIDS